MGHLGARDYGLYLEIQIILQYLPYTRYCIKWIEYEEIATFLLLL